MDEVWVPSEWQRATFAASGVDPSKLRVVPEVGGLKLAQSATRARAARVSAGARVQAGLSQFGGCLQAALERPEPDATSRLL